MSGRLGWSRNRLGHNSGNRFVEDATLTPTAAGYAFQLRPTRQMVERLDAAREVLELRRFLANAGVAARSRRRRELLFHHATPKPAGGVA